MRSMTTMKVLVAWLLAATVTPVVAAEDSAFDWWFIGTARQAETEPGDRRIPFDTKVYTENLADLAYGLYRREIAGDQFGKTVSGAYRGRRYEIDFLAQHLPE